MPGMTAEYASGDVHRPDRDKRIRDPQRYLHGKLREAEAMIALWERSLQAGRAADAGEQLHYWRRQRFAIPQQISRIEIGNDHD
jgi:hypothetical protein